MLSRRLLFRSFLLLGIGFAVCWGVLLYPQVKARYLLYRLKDIEVDRSTFEDAQKFAEEVGATPFGECTRAECLWYRHTDNALLPRWYRGKGVAFAIIFTVKDSIVTDKGVQYSVGVEPSADEAYIGQPRVYVAESESWFKGRAERQQELHKRLPEQFPDYIEPPIEKGWEKMWYDEATGKVVVDYYAVAISPRSTTISEDWKKYTAFRYSCFWRYKGCVYGRDLLPLAGPYPPRPS